MTSFYDKNLPLIHNDVKDFFARNLFICPEYENGECLDIIVAIDGSYSHIGHHSSGGVSFISEIFTGRLLDYEYTEKCFKCKSCNIFDSKNPEDKCPDGKFHGSSGQMEVQNALILFRRSQQWGFRYTIVVSDGDNKVYPRLRDANIYGPDVKIEKYECANHLQKRCHKSLLKFGKNYKGVNVGTGTPLTTPSTPLITDF